MVTKELTPRQIREKEAYEAEKAADIAVEHNALMDATFKQEPIKPKISRAMEARNFYRKQAGWPQLRT